MPTESEDLFPSLMLRRIKKIRRSVEGKSWQVNNSRHPLLYGTWNSYLTHAVEGCFSNFSLGIFGPSRCQQFELLQSYNIRRLVPRRNARVRSLLAHCRGFFCGSTCQFTYGCFGQVRFLVDFVLCNKTVSILENGWWRCSHYNVENFNYRWKWCRQVEVTLD